MFTRCKASRLLVALAVLGLAAAFSAPAQAQNLILNPSFTDECLGGVPCQWAANFNATISRDTAVFKTAPASLKITAGTSGLSASAATCISLQPGAYTLSYWYNIADPGAIGARVTLIYYNALNCPTFDNIDSSAVAAATEGGWQQASGNPVAPPDTVSALVIASFICSTNPCPSGAFANFDDISLEAFPTAATFRGLSATASSAGTLLRWRTAFEVNLLGFNVYREAHAKRTRINRRLIAAAGRGRYSFLDRKAPTRPSVRYWIQTVNLDGSRTWYGPARVTRPA